MGLDNTPNTTPDFKSAAVGSATPNATPVSQTTVPGDPGPFTRAKELAQEGVEAIEHTGAVLAKGIVTGVKQVATLGFK